ncbi:unnamed protein product [Didymodactylos carnosus]|uniref:Flavin-containing monooxygenase n=1 Tax=Didymodactylos carnosus TaxID=1234261 RepID=A0A815PAQ3_9BILA|nr:unnamed protein product [Didymodactylos carnosus]CAF1446620.1 unnamed protein product [Didymodactylos carnosus]CAF4066647.1 unnamed protein product [Didymodactylos carnosus]CAF4321111.1 unnamed protein product [Didymodactylos carnosus]
MAPSSVSSSNNDVPLWKVFFLFLGAVFIYLLSIILGLICHFIYFLATELINFFKNPFHKSEIKWNHGEGDGTREKPYCVIIIGSGFSGLGLAIKLKQLNMNDYILYERRENVGGTWYDNKYPEHLTDKHNLREKIRFNTKVTEAEWLDDCYQWKVTINTGQSFYSRFLVSAHGPLANAQFPTNISGIDQFKGDMFHSAEWNTAYDFTEKRVAVIGTGASSVQLVPIIQKHVKQLYVFQRTPPWIIPRLDRKVTDFEKWLFEQIPLIQKAVRSVIYWTRESVVLSFAYQWPVKTINQQLAKFFISTQVKDVELRKKLTPTWELGCKRVVLSNDWYPTLQKPNVQLVTDGIKQVNEHSIVTSAGTEYELDAIIWSTGFQVQGFPINIRGIEGKTVEEQWLDSPQAYKGVTTPNFPNLFFILGPNSGLGHNSILLMIESQFTYILKTIEYMDQNHIDKFLVKQQACQQYNDRLQAKLKKTVWQSGGCKSWYQDRMGNNTAIWPDFTWSYRLIMQNFDYDKYDLFSIDNKKTD